MIATLSQVPLPAGFDAWPPTAQAFVLAALTFVTEDAVAVGGALLAALGRLGWPTAFWGVFLGIWAGDAVLYGLARRWGRGLLIHPRAQRWVLPARLAAAERWFAERGTAALWLCRMIPGFRLPTYLAAGLLRMPFLRFALATGVAAFVWTGAIFVFIRILGDQAINALGEVHGALLVLVGIGLVSALASRGAPPFRESRLGPRLRGWLGRWARWEFWPPWVFYAPVVLHCLWLSIRHRGCTLPTVANPGMPHGGVVGESKFEILRDLMATSPEFTAAAIRIESGSPATRLATLRAWMREQTLGFPVVLKPDLGQRGAGFRIVTGPGEALAHFHAIPAPLVAQRHVPGPFEAGVFYVRRPGEPRGRILGITEKVFPRLIGDGLRTLEELLWDEPRARCLTSRYLERLGARTSEVLPAGETLALVQAGNHAQGCVFRDGAAWWTPALEERFDAISRRLSGFHFGRYDVRFSSLEAFRAGEDFRILELNGAAAEMTSIYDARHSLWTGYRTLFDQWRLAYEIGALNRQRGWRPTPPLVLLRTWWKAARGFAALPIAD